MATVDRIIDEAQSLSEEDRTRIIDALLTSLSPIEPDIEHAWVEEVKRRSADLRSGQVTPIPHDEVLSRLRKRFPDL